MKRSVRKVVNEVTKYWKQHGRHNLPWRKTRNPYKIMVSEIMLQQTQVDRVVPYYTRFLERFPTIPALAEAPLAEVLKLWSGLGYNRRAKFLHEAAKAVVALHGGKLPRTVADLEDLPGIGPYTARAVATFAYNSREVFIETNIRTVFLHHCFPGKERVPDSDLMPLVAEAAEHAESPREWYAALMDYGTHLKKQLPNPSRRSRHHTKQSRFEGSLRQVRGAIVKLLHEQPHSAKDIMETTGFEAARVDTALTSLEKEGFITKKRHRWQIV